MAMLAGLEDELTCSICLCLFESPVTTPCGHNFCAACLDITWAGLRDAFSCPQCRSPFASKPELRKNTVLCRVVEQLQVGTNAPEGGEPEGKKGWEPEGKKGGELGPSQVACDSCPEAVAAVQTCLTCMASFCAEHLRPHHDSLAFRVHELRAPVHDLQQRLCRDHHKLLDFYCPEHQSCICCICLVGHKACSASSLPEAKAQKELQLKKRLTELRNQNDKASMAMNEIKIRERKVTEAAAHNKDLLRNEFLEVKVLIEEQESQSVKKLEEEEKRVRDKFDYVHKVLGKKKSEIQSLKDKLESTLAVSDDIAFLEKAAKLQLPPTKDVFVPRIDLDSNVMHSVYLSATLLKEILKKSASQPEEQRMEGHPQWKPKPLCLMNVPLLSPVKPKVPSKKPVGPQAPKGVKTPQQLPQESNVSADGKRIKPSKSVPNLASPDADTSIESFLKKSREELLHYATKVTLDFNTAHNKVLLLEKNTKISVSETPQNYSSHPQRFSYCSQVLGFQCFKRGIYYWEVELQRNNFCGIGICYGSMDRQGADSRLGRNRSSWCIEWFNAKISAWHNDNEKSLPNTKATKIGVLLNWDAGFVLFLAVDGEGESKSKEGLCNSETHDEVESIYQAEIVAICSRHSRALSTSDAM
ncbi:E3 ubiquitin/ISG15 ligase TRIM25 isoform B [Alligator mississippiensis]|uniref:E3 ubiquitin/ISG15 ligase TRIM25 isoform B n=1 Tax=Alligator mississippiensis TaxID=8496 RepID=A0A151N2K2_ALLMI|nr:E3 ubiquitin/ISG15 ligase TRIM25 isoform B [Alligator mississippiensis]